MQPVGQAKVLFCLAILRMSLTSDLGLVTSYYSSDPRCFATNFSGLIDSQLRPCEVRTKMVLVAAKAADVDVKLQAWPARIERVCCLALHLAAHI